MLNLTSLVNIWGEGGSIILKIQKLKSRPSREMHMQYEKKYSSKMRNKMLDMIVSKLKLREAF